MFKRLRTATLLLVATLAITGVRAGAQTFVSDSFTDTAATLLQNHIEPISGVDWTGPDTGNTGSLQVTGSPNANRLTGSVSGSNDVYLSPNGSASADVDAYLSFTCLDASVSGANVMIGARAKAGSLPDLYFAGWVGGTGWQIYKRVGGVSSVLFTNNTNAPTSGNSYTMHLQAHGTTVALLVSVNGGAESSYGSVTDSSISGAAGGDRRAAIVAFNIGNSSSAGTQLTNFHAQSYSTAPPVTIAINDANWQYSPYGWYMNGSLYAQTGNNGSYSRVGFSGTSATLAFDLTPNGANPLPRIRYSIDGGPSTDVSIAGSVAVASGLSSGNHLLEFWMLSSSSTVDAWSLPANVCRVTGLVIDGGAASVAPAMTITPPIPKTKNMIVFGDSITEGKLVAANSDPAGQDAVQTYGQYLGLAFSAEVGIIGWGGQGLTVNGARNVPRCYDTGTPANGAWRNYYSGQSRLVAGLLSPAPDYIVINHGTNDSIAGVSNAAFTTALNSFLTDLRAAAPSAKIFVLAPVGGFMRTAINNATLPDANCYILDLGPSISYGLTNAGSPSQRSYDGLHPSAWTHAQIGAMLSQSMQNKLGGLIGRGRKLN